MPAVKVLLAFSLITAIFYLILRHLELDAVEAVIFSSIFAIGIFSTYTYWLALLFGISTAMIISLVLIAAIAAYFHFYVKHQRKQLYIPAAIIALVLILYLLAYLFAIRSMPIPEYVQQFYECIKNIASSSEVFACAQKY